MRARLALAAILTLGLAIPEAAGHPNPSPKPSPKASSSQHSFSFSFASGKGRLGVGVTSMTPELRQFFGAKKTVGILVSRVQPGSVAERARIRVGDVLVKVDGDTIDDVSDVHLALSDRSKGDRVDIVVVRKKKRVRLTATMDDGPAVVRQAPGRIGGFTAPDPTLRAPRADDKIERELEEARRRLREVERRLDRIEKKRSRARKGPRT